MAGVALVLLAIFLGLLLHKAFNKPPFTRERPPLVPLPLQKRGPMAVYPPSNSYLFDTVPDTTAFSNSVTLKGFTRHLEGMADKKVLEGDVPLEAGTVTVSTLHISTLGHHQSSLHRSVSQLIDKKSMDGDDSIWDHHVRSHDSGLFMDNESFADTVKGFSTVRKEHTMFTDTNL
ncbi:usherin-like [Denticeps clupeoides]|uniref:usherin-like n=1 Tax=Denticeps clupeoides TaxID=299321 RepID=UPI0010A375EB|nr:usherin-like [Denticeps clupeoides]